MILSTRDNGNWGGFSKTVRSTVSGDVITLADTKSFMRVDTADDNTLISTLIEASIDMAERYANITLRRKEYTFEYVDYGREILLPYGPHVSVDAVRTKTDGVETTLSASYYQVVGQDFKTLILDSSVASYQLEVDVTAGYGASSVPDLIKLALYKSVLSHYEDRQDLFAGGVSELPNSSKQLLNIYRRIPI